MIIHLTWTVRTTFRPRQRLTWLFSIAGRSPSRSPRRSSRRSPSRSPSRSPRRISRSPTPSQERWQGRDSGLAHDSSPSPQILVNFQANRPNSRMSYARDFNYKKRKQPKEPKEPLLTCDGFLFKKAKRASTRRELDDMSVQYYAHKCCYVDRETGVICQKSMLDGGHEHWWKGRLVAKFEPEF